MENEEPLEDTQSQAEVDPWEQAFAALDKEAEENSEASSDSDAGEASNDAAADTDGSADSDSAEASDGNGSESAAGGSDPLGDQGEQQAAGAYDDLFRFTDEEVTEYKESLQKSIEEQALRDVSAAYIKKGARHNGNNIGATINDEDICKRDNDGIPHFYNPETGREFTGDNPRRQAQDWVDDYNKQLADAFNKTCQDYSKKLLEEQGHGLKVIEFAPKYEKLDPVRKAMFESIIEDYEITDKDGDLVGYSCDLDKALAAVNRQVRTMQTRFKGSTPTKPAATGPVLDSKTTNASANDNGKPEFKSLAEAMEWQQTQLLNKSKAKRK